jgi:hypothetical protein
MERADRPADRGGGRKSFVAGLVMGVLLASSAAWGWSFAHRSTVPAPAEVAPISEAEVLETMESESGTGDAAPSDDALQARWLALRAAYLDAAAPLGELFDRANRLREVRPIPQTEIMEAAAAYQTAKRARESAEADEARYLQDADQGEELSARNEVASGELAVAQAQAALEELHHSRKKFAEGWMKDGATQKSARGSSNLFFQKYLQSAEVRLEQAKLRLSQAKARRDRLTRYTRPMRTKSLQAEVEARRVAELASQAALEKLKAQQSPRGSKGSKLVLSPNEKHLLEQLVEILRIRGARPPKSDAPAEFREFLDQFEAGLAGPGAPLSEQQSAHVPRRYDALIDQLSQTLEVLEVN